MATKGPVVVVSDESGHEYLIPLARKDEFDHWVATFEWGYEGDDADGVGLYDFDPHRVDGISDLVILSYRWGHEPADDNE